MDRNNVQSAPAQISAELVFHAVVYAAFSGVPQDPAGVFIQAGNRGVGFTADIDFRDICLVT